jgi:hypothetical protein
VVPQTLHHFSGSQQSEVNERIRVVKDFCFPNGVLLKKLEIGSPETEKALQDVLYVQTDLRGSTFIFTLDANEEAG